MINYKLLLNLLKLTILITDYGKTMENYKDEIFTNYLLKMKNSKEVSNLDYTVISNLIEDISNGVIIEFIKNDATNLQACILLSKTTKQIIIIFGNNSSDKWYDKYHLFKTKLKNTYNVYVNTSIHHKLTDKNIHLKMIELLTKLLLIHPEYNIQICGYGIGGSLATLFGYLIADEIHQNVTVVSFGSPRVGNYNWKQMFNLKRNLKHYRVVNKYDMITIRPFIRYYHVGKKIELHQSFFKFFENNKINHSQNEYYQNILMNI